MRPFFMLGQYPVPLLFALGLTLLLAACDSGNSATNQGFVHIDESATATALAITQEARENPSPTPGPSPTPLPTLVPYVIPTPDPTVDLAQTIMRVGNDDITLGDYQKQVRFERWWWLYQVVNMIEQRGTNQVLDLSAPENARIAAMLATLDDSSYFGAEVHRTMTIDAVAVQEARRRGIEVDPQQFDAILAQYLGLTIGTDGQLPPEFDATYADFLASMTTYTGMTEEEFRRIIRARTLYEHLKFIISNQPETNQLVEDASTGVEVHDLLLETEDLANEVVSRLQNGETLDEIATSLGFVRNEDQQQHIVRADDTTLPEAVLEALFSASPGAIVGPIATTEGWYVAVVGDPVFDMLSTDEISAIKQQYFLDWLDSLVDDPDYVQDFDNWRDHIPADPQPHDMSPLLSDENVILPGEE